MSGIFCNFVASKAQRNFKIKNANMKQESVQMYK